jgi:hypothetical protein
VTPAPAAVKIGRHDPPVQRRRHQLIRNRPKSRPTRFGSGSRFSLRRD